MFSYPPFPTISPILSKTEIVILATFDFSSANAFNVDKAQDLLFGKGAICQQK